VTPAHSSPLIVLSGSLLWGNPHILTSPQDTPLLGLYNTPASRGDSTVEKASITLINLYEKQSSFTTALRGTRPSPLRKSSALESIKYIENAFNNRICTTIGNCKELKKLLLREVTEHSQAISLQQLVNVIPEKVFLIDRIPMLQQLGELVVSYRALLRHLFALESKPEGTIRAFVIGSKYGEIVGEASIIRPPQIPMLPPRAPTPPPQSPAPSMPPST